MKIIMAREAGFCMGVKRALEMILARARKESREIITYGPLIHNPQIVSLLVSQNVRACRDISQITPDSRLFISAHGISPRVRNRLRATNAKIYDATCPDVLKVQGIIKKYARNGYATVIFGDKGHTEVEGLLGFVEGKGYVVSEVSEIYQLPPLEKVLLVSQTTQDRKVYEEVARNLKARFPEVVVGQTICPSTRSRQRELVNILRKVEAMVVVGGKDSANTARLTAIVRRHSLPVFQVETAEELDMKAVGRFNVIGVTAGASTPNWLLQGVVDRLREWNWQNKSRLVRWGYTFLVSIIKSNVFISLGAVSLTYASCRLMNIPLRPWNLMLSFCAVLAIYTLNILVDQSVVLLKAPARFRFYHRHHKGLLISALSGLALSLLLMIMLGKKVFILGFIAFVLGLVYFFPFLPRSFNFKRLKDLPGCKEIFTSVGWAVLVTILPAYAGPTPAPGLAAIGVAFIFVFITIFVRSTLFDIRDVQNDRMIGRETVPVLLGKKRTKIVLVVLLFFLSLIMLVAAAGGWVAPVGYYYLVSLGYTGFYLVLYHRRIIYQGLLQEILVDAQLILIGLIAWLAPS